MSTPYNKIGKRKPKTYQRRNPMQPVGYPATPPFVDQPVDDSSDNSDQPYTPRFQNYPDLYDASGKINPNYDTSIGQDMLAGAGIASQMGNGNPFHDVGLAIGGLVGGAFKKNLAGQVQYDQDTKQVDAYNKQVVMMTDAQARLEAQKIARDREARLSAHQAKLDQIRTDTFNLKDRKQRIDYNLNILNNDPDEDSRATAAQMLAQDGYPVSTSYGVKYKQAPAGDYTGLVDQFGNFKYLTDPSTGQPVSKLTTDSYLNILKKAQDVSGYDEGAMQWALNEAKKSIEASGLRFEKGQQESTAVLNLARTYLKEQGKKKGTVTIGDQTYEIPIPPRPTSTGEPAAPPTDTTPEVADANAGAWVNQFTTPAQIDQQLKVMQNVLAGSKDPTERQMFQTNIQQLKDRRNALIKNPSLKVTNPPSLSAKPANISQPTTTNPAQTQRPIGTTAKDKNGKLRRWNGTGWVLAQ